MLAPAAGRAAAAVAAATLARLQPALAQAAAQQSTLAAQEVAAQVVAPEASAAAPAPAVHARSFYKRQLPRELVPFASTEGKRIFRDALDDGSVDSFFPLVQHFQTQSEPASCALGTLCMVLNAMGIDPGLSWKGPWRWWSEEVLLSRWDAATASLPADQRRAIADVRGAGMSLAEFASLSRATGLHTIERHADTSSLAEFQEAVWQALGCGVGCNTAAAPGADHRHTPRGGRGGTHVVVSFNRAALKQTGEGHFSPLGGYSRRHAAVLVMDVARFKYPPYWVSLPALWEAMQPPDPTTGRPRGYVVLKAATIPRDSDRCPLGDVQLDARPSPAAVALGRTHAHHRQLGHPGAAARLRAHLEGCTHGCP